MKRDAIFAAVICFLAIIMIVSGSFMIMPSAAEAAVVGKFTLVEGTVDLLKGGSLPAVPATLNLSVEEKDVVRTKSNARAEIALLDKTVLRVAQRSRIDISEYSGDDASKKGVIKLDRGKIEAIVEKKPVSRITTGAKANSFEIHTPNAVAGVRGTDFFVSYDKNVSTTLVKDGNVCSFNISSPENEVCMPPGFITSIVGTNPPERPKAATREELNLFEKEFIGITKAGSQPVSVAASNPATITDMPIVIPPEINNNTPSFPVSAEGFFSGSEGIDITGTGSLSVSNSTASMTLNGTYTSSEPSNNWFMNVMTTGVTGPFGEADLTGTQWSNNVLVATAAGYWIDTTPATPTTGIYIGETTGTFNPANSTWQTVVHGSWLETNQYLAMTATPSGQATLTSLNIPAVEVGRVDLSGAIFADGTSGSDFVSVLMNNVIFFAPSTGQKPGIWATNAITGTYDFTNGSGLNAGTIISPDNVITLEDGNTISADFQFTQWQGGKWVGRVRNGAGDLSGGNGSFTGPINFRGGAAGTHTGTTSGALSGTAAGIVK